MLLWRVSRRLICKCRLCLFVLLCWDLNLTSQQAEGLFLNLKSTGVVQKNRNQNSSFPRDSLFPSLWLTWDVTTCGNGVTRMKSWNLPTVREHNTRRARAPVWAWRRTVSALMMRTASTIIRVAPVDTPFSLQCLLNHEIQRWIPRYCSRGDLKLDRVMVVQKRRRRDASAFGAMINIQFLLVCSWEERKDKKSSGPVLRTADEEQQEEEIWQSSTWPMFVCIIELFSMCCIVNLPMILNPFMP